MSDNLFKELFEKESKGKELLRQAELRDIQREAMWEVLSKHFSDDLLVAVRRANLRRAKSFEVRK